MKGAPLTLDIDPLGHKLVFGTQEGELVQLSSDGFGKRPVDEDLSP